MSPFRLRSRQAHRNIIVAASTQKVVPGCDDKIIVLQLKNDVFAFWFDFCDFYSLSGCEWRTNSPSSVRRTSSIFYFYC